VRLLRNLTLHRQGEREQAFATRAGFLLEAEALGVEIDPARGGLNVAAVLLAGRLARCSAEGMAALIGGHTALWIAALDILTVRSVKRPDLLYFETARTRDIWGRFLFVPERLIKLPAASTPRIRRPTLSPRCMGLKEPDRSSRRSKAAV
jgi:hypothetical protein